MGQKGKGRYSRTLDEWERRIMKTVETRIDRLRKKGKKSTKKAHFIRFRMQKISRGLP